MSQQSPRSKSRYSIFIILLVAGLLIALAGFFIQKSKQKPSVHQPPRQNPTISQPALALRSEALPNGWQAVAQDVAQIKLLDPATTCTVDAQYGTTNNMQTEDTAAVAAAAGGAYREEATTLTITANGGKRIVAGKYWTLAKAGRSSSVHHKEATIPAHNDTEVKITLDCGSASSLSSAESALLAITFNVLK